MSYTVEKRLEPCADLYTCGVCLLVVDYVELHDHLTTHSAICTRYVIHSDTRIVVPETEMVVPETEMVVPETDMAAQETEMVVPPETDMVVPETDMAAQETEMAAQTVLEPTAHFSPEYSSTMIPQTDVEQSPLHATYVAFKPEQTQNKQTSLLGDVLNPSLYDHASSEVIPSCRGSEVKAAGSLYSMSSEDTQEESSKVKLSKSLFKLGSSAIKSPHVAKSAKLGETQWNKEIDSENSVAPDRVEDSSFVSDVPYDGRPLNIGEIMTVFQIPYVQGNKTLGKYECTVIVTKFISSIESKKRKRTFTEGWYGPGENSDLEYQGENEGSEHEMATLADPCESTAEHMQTSVIQQSDYSAVPGMKKRSKKQKSSGDSPKRKRSKKGIRTGGRKGTYLPNTNIRRLGLTKHAYDFKGNILGDSFQNELKKAMLPKMVNEPGMAEYLGIAEDELKLYRVPLVKHSDGDAVPLVKQCDVDEVPLVKHSDADEVPLVKQSGVDEVPLVKHSDGEEVIVEQELDTGSDCVKENSKPDNLQNIEKQTSIENIKTDTNKTQNSMQFMHVEENYSHECQGSNVQENTYLDGGNRPNCCRLNEYDVHIGKDHTDLDPNEIVGTAVEHKQQHSRTVENTQAEEVSDEEQAEKNTLDNIENMEHFQDNCTLVRNSIPIAPDSDSSVECTVTDICTDLLTNVTCLVEEENTERSGNETCTNVGLVSGIERPEEKLSSIQNNIQNLQDNELQHNDILEKDIDSRFQNEEELEQNETEEHIGHKRGGECQNKGVQVGHDNEQQSVAQCNIQNVKNGMDFHSVHLSTSDPAKENLECKTLDSNVDMDGGGTFVEDVRIVEQSKTVSGIMKEMVDSLPTSKTENSGNHGDGVGCRFDTEKSLKNVDCLHMKSSETNRNTGTSLVDLCSVGRKNDTAVRLETERRDNLSTNLETLLKAKPDGTPLSDAAVCDETIHYGSNASADHAVLERDHCYFQRKNPETSECNTVKAAGQAVGNERSALSDNIQDSKSTANVLAAGSNVSTVLTPPFINYIQPIMTPSGVVMPFSLAPVPSGDQTQFYCIECQCVLPKRTKYVDHINLHTTVNELLLSHSLSIEVKQATAVELVKRVVNSENLAKLGESKRKQKGHTATEKGKCSKSTIKESVKKVVIDMINSSSNGAVIVNAATGKRVFFTKSGANSISIATGDSSNTFTNIRRTSLTGNITEDDTSLGNAGEEKQMDQNKLMNTTGNSKTKEMLCTRVENEEKTDFLQFKDSHVGLDNTVAAMDKQSTCQGIDREFPVESSKLSQIGENTSALDMTDLVSMNKKVSNSDKIFNISGQEGTKTNEAKGFEQVLCDEDTYACDMCGEIFNDTVSLIAHVKSHSLTISKALNEGETNTDQLETGTSGADGREEIYTDHRDNETVDDAIISNTVHPDIIHNEFVTKDVSEDVSKETDTANRKAIGAVGDSLENKISDKNVCVVDTDANSDDNIKAIDGKNVCVVDMDANSDDNIEVIDDKNVCVIDIDANSGNIEVIDGKNVCVVDMDANSDDNIKVIDGKNVCVVDIDANSDDNIEVIDEYSDGEHLLTCDLCGEIVESRRVLVKHIKLHPEDQVYLHYLRKHVCSVCLRCGRSFYQDIDLRCHLNSQDCKARALFVAALDENFEKDSVHERDNTDDKVSQHKLETFDKSVIKPKIIRKRTVKREVKQMYPEIADDDKRFHCKWCRRPYDTDHDLLIHECRCHFKPKEKCSHCDFESSAFSTLSRHYLDAHNIKKRHECDKCEKSFLTARELRIHTEAEHENKMYICEHCGKTFKFQKYLMRHTVLNHQKSFFPCSYCRFKCLTPNGLKLHEKKHKGDYDNFCVPCEKVFPGNSNYILHMSDVHKMAKKEANLILTEAVRVRGTLCKHKCLTCNEIFPLENAYYMHMASVHSVSQEDAEQFVQDRIRQIEKERETDSNKLANKESFSVLPKHTEAQGVSREQSEMETEYADDKAVFDETLHKLVDSYLRNAPRSYDVIHKLPEQAKERHDEIHRLIFFSCLRMATYKESKTSHITPSVFGEILYENFIFDIPKLLDLCVLYGRDNRPLLSKMIETIFTNQPNYNDDLHHTIDSLGQVFDNVMSKCGIHPDPASVTPQKIDEVNGSGPRLVTMEMSDLQDVIYYLSDIGMTLTSFLEVYPAACQAFHDSDFLQRLPVFYDAVIPEVMVALKLRDMDPSEKTLLKQTALQGKKSLLAVFQAVISKCCIQPLLDKEGVATDYVEDYLHIVSSILGERRFLSDYECVMSFQGDLDVIFQASSGVDETRIQYIQEAINQAFATFGKRKAPKGATNRGGRRSPEGSPGPIEGGGAVGGAVGGASTVGGASAAVGGASAADNLLAYQVESADVAGACAPTVTGVELDSLISSVKDLLPELGDGFIELCLEELSYDVERVINGVLEDRLPPALCEIDRLLKREKKEPPPDSLVTQRKNIYDYDEFDVFHRDDVDKSKVYKGKASKTDDVRLGDDSVIKDIKSNISKDYGVVIDVVEDDGTYARDIYDDEYDDTYDTNVVGADDADSADELTGRRPFTVPRVLGGQVHRSKQQANQSSSEDSDTEAKKRDQFVEDPAVLRQRAEERARSKAGGRGRGHSQPQAQPKKHDVKGGPKGQGQSDEVLRNRKWKTQHKGDFRRNQADKKRKA